MSVRRFLIPLALLASATAAAWSCGDPSPVGVALQTPALLAARSRVLSQPTGSGKPTGLVGCSQTYDSVTQVIGPAGGYFAVGPHILYVDALALSNTVSITAVAPAGTVRWVRFQPDGLVFQTNPNDGWGAILYTSYKDCGVPTSDTLRIAQVTDSLSILGYLQSYVKTKNVPWSQATQYVAALLPHFSNYAVAW